MPKSKGVEPFEGITYKKSELTLVNKKKKYDNIKKKFIG
jgi:hypothetical protein